MSIPVKKPRWAAGRHCDRGHARISQIIRAKQNLRIQNLDVECAEDDQRPALVCDDVRELDVLGLRAMSGCKSDAVIRFKNVQDAMIHGCRSRESVKAYLRVEGDQSQGLSVVSSDLRKAANPIVRADDVSEDAIRTDQP